MISALGFSNRGYLSNFERFFYDTASKNGIIQKNCAIHQNPYSHGCQDLLGRNWSFFISTEENTAKTKMVLFDADDGAGWNTDQFKLKQDGFERVTSTFNVDDFIVFKAQYTESKLLNRFYPPQDKTYPLGYFCDNPDKILSAKKRIKKIPVKDRDIDFLWIGTLQNHLEQKVWPEDLSLEYWTPGIRKRCFERVKEILEKRQDLNIVCSDKPIEFNKYIDLVGRSKVCLEFPGIGYNTRRFFENLIMEKACLMYKNEMKLPYEIKEGYHYECFNANLENMEDKMDEILSDTKKVETIEDNLHNSQSLFTYDFASENIKSIFKSHFGREI
jgi:hypothetical protein